MRIGMPLSYSAGDFGRAAGELPDYERAGLDIVFAPEAYTFDSISQLGYIAAKTSTLEIASDILNIYSRTPALLRVSAHLALYIGGMGAKGKNFYNELVCRYGFEEAAGNVQDLYLSGRKVEAAAALPEELARGLSLIGPALAIKDRIDAFAASGATTVNVKPVAATHEQRVRDVARLREICS